jgi:hypothetical protein
LAVLALCLASAMLCDACSAKKAIQPRILSERVTVRTPATPSPPVEKAKTIRAPRKSSTPEGVGTAGTSSAQLSALGTTGSGAVESVPLQPPPAANRMPDEQAAPATRRPGVRSSLWIVAIAIGCLAAAGALFRSARVRVGRRHASLMREPVVTDRPDVETSLAASEHPAGEEERKPHR